MVTIGSKPELCGGALCKSPGAYFLTHNSFLTSAFMKYTAFGRYNIQLTMNVFNTVSALRRSSFYFFSHLWYTGLCSAERQCPVWVIAGCRGHSLHHRACQAWGHCSTSNHGCVWWYSGTRRYRYVITLLRQLWKLWPTDGTNSKQPWSTFVTHSVCIQRVYSKQHGSLECWSLVDKELPVMTTEFFLNFHLGLDWPGSCSFKVTL